MKKIISLVLVVMILLTFAIQVAAFRSIAVKSIKLDSSNVTLKAGQTYSLKLSFTPADTTQKLVTYSSANKKVATVDSKGKITAVGAGQTVITVTSRSNKKAIARCTITVKANVIKKATMMVFGPPQRKWAGSPLQTIVKQKFGLDLTLNILDEKSYSEKYPVMVASGNLPDAATAYDNFTNLNMQGDHGLLMNLKDKLDKLPAIKAFMSKYPIESKNLYSDKKGMYVIPKVMDEKSFWNALIVRGDILDKAKFNYKNMKSMDDFYAMFQTLQKTSGKNGFYGSMEGLYSWTALAYAWGVSGGTRFWNYETNKWSPGYTVQGYKDMLKFAAKMYKNKMIDPDFLTMQKKAWLEKVYNGEILAFAGGIGYIDELNIEMQKTDRSVRWTWVKLPAYNGKLYKWQSNSNFISEGGFILNPKTKAADELLSFINWLYTDEGFKAFNFGKLGDTYVEENGIPHYLQDKYKNTVSPALAQKSKWLNDAQWAAKQNAWPVGITSLVPFTPEWYFLGKQNSEYGKKSTLELLYNDEKDIYAGPWPPQTFTQEEADEVSNIKNSIETFGLEWSTNAVLGKINIDAEWNDFVKECNNMGMQKLVQLHTDMTKRFNDSRK